MNHVDPGIILNSSPETWAGVLLPPDEANAACVTAGFYEWRKSDKQLFAIALSDDDLMVMAGLWDEWRSPGSASRAAR